MIEIVAVSVSIGWIDRPSAWDFHDFLLKQDGVIPA